MTDERLQIQITQVEVDTSSEPRKWGEMPTAKRISELEARLEEWEHLTPDQRGSRSEDGGASAFDIIRHGTLSGADVYYLAARALAGSADQADIAAAASVLPSTDPPRKITLDLSDLYLDGADLRGAHLEGADLGYAHLDGADFGYAHLERATLSVTRLQRAFLSGAHLEGAILFNAHLEGAMLDGAHLEGADPRFAHLEGAMLDNAHLQGLSLGTADLKRATLVGAHLEGADLRGAHLEGADLRGAHLEGADMRRAFFDKTSRLNEAVLTGASFDQVTFDNTNLTVVKWGHVAPLGDELRAFQLRDENGKPKDRPARLADFEAAVRANRVLAVALRAQGLADDADIFAYRAQVLQRHLRFQQRQYGRWLFSALLALLSGYGYRLGNIFRAYALVVIIFALGYLVPALMTTGQAPGGQDALNALQISLNAIHGRVFFANFTLDTAQSWLATAESICGIVIEGVFVAMLIQRLFR